MNNLFASHKGKIFKRLLFLALGLAIAMMFVNIMSDSEQPAAQTQANNTAREDEGPSVDYAPVYADATATPTATPEPSLAAGNDEELITNDVKTLASDFVEGWTTYDYDKPGNLADLEGVPVDSENRANLDKSFKSLMDGAKEREERSTGNIESVAISSLDYTGSHASGEGQGTVEVAANVTVSNQEVGSAGATAVKNYEVSVVKSRDSSDDGNNWYVSDIKEVS